MKNFSWYVVQALAGLAILATDVAWNWSDGQPKFAFILAIFTAAFATLAVTRIIELFTLGGFWRWFAATLYVGPAILFAAQDLAKIPPDWGRAMGGALLWCALLSGAIIAVVWTKDLITRIARRGSAGNEAGRDGHSLAGPDGRVSQGSQQIPTLRIGQDIRKLP